MCHKPKKPLLSSSVWTERLGASFSALTQLSCRGEGVATAFLKLMIQLQNGQLLGKAPKHVQEPPVLIPNTKEL